MSDRFNLSPTNACYPVSYEIHKIVYENSITLNLAAGSAGLIFGVSTILIAFTLWRRIKFKQAENNRRGNIESWEWSKTREPLGKLQSEAITKVRGEAGQHQIGSTVASDHAGIQWLNIQSDIEQLRERFMLKLLKKFPNRISEEQLMTAIIQRLTYSTILAKQDAENECGLIWNAHYGAILLIKGIENIIDDRPLEFFHPTWEMIMKEAIDIEYLVSEIALGYIEKITQDCQKQLKVNEKRGSQGSTRTVVEIHQPDDDHDDQAYQLGTDFDNRLDSFINETYKIDPSNLEQILDLSHSQQKTERLEIDIKAIIAAKYANFDADSIAELLPCLDEGMLCLLRRRIRL